jgi:serine/threonine-protein kinase
VDEVWDPHVHRAVARKVQRVDRCSADERALFQQEIIITARLQHPGVVPLYDWGELPDGRVWFTMKLVRGETIESRIAALHHQPSGQPFLRALRRTLDDFRRLCEPVAYAHEKGIIHRDLTPANLMIGDLGEVHVMDWGLARDLSRAAAAQPSEESPRADRSERTRIAGTAPYMSPEQATGRISLMGPASDVYALGAVLYQILCGRAPYDPGGRERAAWDQILRQVLAGPPPPVAGVATWPVPKELAAICDRAMAREPWERYANAVALMEALRDWLDGTDRQERARRIVAEADREHRPRIEAMRREAEALRASSRALLGKLRDYDPAQDKAEGWALADRAQATEQRALREEIYWTQKVRSALNEAPDLEEAHDALAAHYLACLLGAEAENDEPSAARFAAHLEDHARHLSGAARARCEAVVRGKGRLTIVTDPPDAEVVIAPYMAVDRYLMPDDRRARVEAAPVRELRLGRGSYLVRLRAPGRREVRYPVAIGRDEHWDGVRPGSAAPWPIRLLRDEDLGEDDVYVPAGWFVAGGDPRAAEALPRRRVWVDAFVVRRHPVTNQEYVAFLNDLVALGRAGEALERCPHRRYGATASGGDPPAYAQDAAGRFALRDPGAEGALPVVLVDWSDAMAYAAFLARTTGQPWRLPSELEWEKAARGVDGRFMPWGDHVEPTWACGAGSHPDRKQVLSVHAYPTDMSPYGVRGMAGNVRDWCIERWQLDGPTLEDGILRIEPASAGDGDERAMRGGAWTTAGDTARLAVRFSDKPGTRHGVLGFRLVRSLLDGGDPTGAAGVL